MCAAHKKLGLTAHLGDGHQYTVRMIVILIEKDSRYGMNDHESHEVLLAMAHVKVLVLMFQSLKHETTILDAGKSASIHSISRF